jgi:hypothetical protein
MINWWENQRDTGRWLGSFFQHICINSASKSGQLFGIFGVKCWSLHKETQTIHHFNLKQREWKWYFTWQDIIPFCVVLCALFCRGDCFHSPNQLTNINRINIRMRFTLSNNFPHYSYFDHNISYSIQFNAIWFNSIQFNSIQFNAMQCNGMQCNAM